MTADAAPSSDAPRELAVLFYEYVPDILERREPHRDAHLSRLRELRETGACVMGGALGDPPHGAVIVFRDAQAAAVFAAEDPYVKAGLVTAHRLEPWRVVV